MTFDDNKMFESPSKFKRSENDSVRRDSNSVKTNYNKSGSKSTTKPLTISSNETDIVKIGEEKLPNRLKTLAKKKHILNEMDEFDLFQSDSDCSHGFFVEKKK